MGEDLKQFKAQKQQKKRYYTLNDVEIHNTAQDCWIILFHEVYDLTNLLQSNIKCEYCDPLIQNAGKDISSWFDESTRDPKTQIDLTTGKNIFSCIQGQFLHMQEYSQNQQFLPWWKNREFIMGKLTRKTRKIKIINMLVENEDIIEVPQEETISEIQERYLQINYHASSYKWKRLGRPLDMDLTLDENDVPDETEEFQRLNIPQSDWYILALHLYFNDYLTFA